MLLDNALGDGGGGRGRYKRPPTSLGSDSHLSGTSFYASHNDVQVNSSHAYHSQLPLLRQRMGHPRAQNRSQRRNPIPPPTNSHLRIIHPLHDEALEVGGNDITVLWNGASDNLHHVWDTEMITKLAGSDTVPNLNAWTSTIVNQIRSGAYAGSVSSWLSCSDITQAQTCATAWASDANALDCSYVPPPSPSDPNNISIVPMFSSGSSSSSIHGTQMHNRGERSL